MSQLPSNPGFFTLTELVKAWTKQDADAETLANRRRTVRENIVNKGCPHTPIGTETVFTHQRFIEWLIENEIQVQSESE